MPGFSTLLIANRGEIACRIIRSAHALGYRTVSVYSTADALARHVQLADRALCIGPPAASDSYLSIERILDAARRAGADAIHPGYGFLSENEHFAAACADAGLTFIGPPAAAIRSMGNKAQAKRLMLAAGVPCVPGISERDRAQGPNQDDAQLLAQAEKIGFPLLIKAAAGGGGRGMRLCTKSAEFSTALASARSEAQSAFGSDEVILERAIDNARHIEIQIFADNQGHCLHLGERECSIQRRHQKILEEAPSPALSDALRAEMGRAAVKAAQTIGYVGAGTVEFLLDAEGQYYFLEMNTRLQVEHPVTEFCTGLDLVELQLRIAAGEPLPLRQEQVKLRGHAIEVRLYAEDPSQDFLPQAGRIIAWQPAQDSADTRTDHGLIDGHDISPYYDPMIAKVIAHGETREHARRRLIRALHNTVLLGPPHNKRFLLDLLEHPLFIAAQATTQFIDSGLAASATRRRDPSPKAWALAALLWTYGGREPEEHSDPWRSNEGAGFSLEMCCNDQQAHLTMHLEAPGLALISGCPGAAGPLRAALLHATGPRHRIEIDGLRESVHAAFEGPPEGALLIEIDGTLHRFSELVPADPNAVDDTNSDGSVRSPTIGRVISLPLKTGAVVKADTTVAIVEAMKIETSLAAGIAGTIASLHVEVGTQIKAGALLVTIEPAHDDRNV